MNEHIIRHEDDKIGRLKSSLSRFQNNLFDKSDVTKHTFIITKIDGSQRIIKANYIEFDVVNKEIEVFKTTGTIIGTHWTNVIDVEEKGE